MGNRTHSFVEGSYYHIYNRGVEKRTIFQVGADYQRFLNTVAFYQQFNLPDKFARAAFDAKERTPPLHYQIVAFALMPNHFHLVIYVNHHGNISKSIGDLLNSYTKNSLHNPSEADHDSANNGDGMVARQAPFHPSGNLAEVVKPGVRPFNHPA